eukprot:scaffold27368_cov67-Skeletonema_dohrnii-CCMP3373.AAC.1
MRSGGPPSFIRHQAYQGSSLKPCKLDKESLLTRTIEVKRPNRKKKGCVANEFSHKPWPFRQFAIIPFGGTQVLFRHTA